MHISRILIVIFAMALLFGGPPVRAADTLPKPFYVTDIPDDDTSLVIAEGDQSETIYPHSYALVIGEVNYAGWDKLTGVPREVNALTKALERQHFKVEVHFDLGSTDMISVISHFMQTRGVEPGSRIVIYISAHGWTRNVVARPSGYVIAVDTPGKQASDTEIASKALPLTMFEAWARAPDPRHMLFVFDSCFSGSFFGYQNNPGTAAGALPPSRAVPFGWGKDENGQLVPPPPETRGIETSDYIENSDVRAEGRQFLAAGSGDQPVPGASIITQLIVQILDDKNTRPQSPADYWTTGDEMGNWISRNGSQLARSLYNMEAPPRPIFAKLPNDQFFQTGDIIFTRNDLPGSPVVVSNPAAWKMIDQEPLSVDQILTKGAATASDAAQIIQVATTEQIALTTAAAAAIPPDASKLTAAEERELGQIVDTLLVDDSTARHAARERLAAWLASLPPAKQAIALEGLLGRFDRKSYRFQLGVSVAIGHQKGKLALMSPAAADAELNGALNAPAGRDAALKRSLMSARSIVKGATAFKF